MILIAPSRRRGTASICCSNIHEQGPGWDVHVVPVFDDFFEQRGLENAFKTASDVSMPR